MFPITDLSTIFIMLFKENIKSFLGFSAKEAFEMSNMTIKIYIQEEKVQGFQRQ